MNAGALSKFERYLWVSQMTPFVSLLICAFIMPGVADEEGGLSNFGNHTSTVALYSLAFLTNAIFLWKAAALVGQPTPQLRFVKVSLRVLSIFVLIVFVSTFPRHLNFTYAAIHDYAGVVLYAYQFVFSVWIVSKKRTLISVSLLTVQTVGAFIALVSTLKIVHLLFIGQSIGATGFSFLLCLTLPGAIKTVDI